MKQYFDKKEVQQFVKALASSIEHDTAAGTTISILGIRKGGAHVADILAKELRTKIKDVEVGYIDVSLYRDDIHRRLPSGPMEGTDIDFSLENKTIILVDDVLCTGRTIRAAIGQVMALGRPRLIRLAVLLDRGGRELPIQADYSGVTMDNPGSGKVRVQCQGNAEDGIYYTPAKERGL